MKILILPKYGPKGASSRYRFYNYEPYFTEQNVHLEFRPLLPDEYIVDLYNKRKIKTFFRQISSIVKRFLFLFLLKKREYHALVIEKELFPNIPYFIEAFLLKGKTYFLDFDDYVGFSYKTDKLKKLIFSDKLNKLVANSALTTVGNRWYFSEFRKGRLAYLPTVIDINDYCIQKKNKETNTIVWVGSPYTAKYLKLIEPVLINLIKEIPFTLKIIGGDIELDKSIPVIRVNWSEVSENEEIASCDIGIMPLEDTLWEKGKCGFKLIQYMASGLPVIGSSLPANEEIIINGETGFIARTENEWFDFLKSLLLNPKEAYLMGKKGRKRVEEHYSYQLWGDKYVSLIKQTIKQLK